MNKKLIVSLKTSSQVLNDFKKAFKLGMKMIWFIITFSFRGYSK